MQTTRQNQWHEQYPARSDPGPLRDNAFEEDDDRWSEKSWRASDEKPCLPELPRELDLETLCRNCKDVYTPEQKARAWSEAAGLVKKYSDEMIERWNTEIDTYLVFAGLFSAVLTALNVESYKLLRPPRPEESDDALRQAIIRLGSPNPAGAEAVSEATSSRTFPGWVIWLNALWFSGLILALSSASIGIMVKQWVDEYKSALSGTSRPVARVRQYRLNNLKKWRVEAIVGVIPVLLQVALTCFLAGLLVLLWNLHHSIAIAATILVGLLEVFTVVTTLLPLFDNTCAYLSPQARMLDYLWRPRCISYRIYSHVVKLYKWLRALPSLWRCPSPSCSGTGEGYCTDDASTSGITPPAVQRSPHPCHRCHIRQLSLNIRGSMSNAAQKCKNFVQSGENPRSTWWGRERSAIARCRRTLDVQILVAAYHSTLHSDALFAATICLKDFSETEVVEYFKQLHDSAREHFGSHADERVGPLGWGNKHELLWLYIILCATLCQDGSSLSEEEWDALRVYFLTGSWSFGTHVADAEWALSALTSMIHHDVAERQLDRKTLLQERSQLLNLCSRRGIRLGKSLSHAVTAAYRQVRLSGTQLADVPCKDSAVSHARHLRNVDWFLECADQALASSLHHDDLDDVRNYTRDVLSDFTRTLLRLFDGEKVDGLHKTIDPRTLEGVTERLRQHVSDGVIHCVPDDFVPDVLRMTALLEAASDYADSETVWRIQYFAREFSKTVVRVKGRPPDIVEPTGTDDERSAEQDGEPQDDTVDWNSPSSGTGGLGTTAADMHRSSSGATLLDPSFISASSQASRAIRVGSSRGANPDYLGSDGGNSPVSFLVAS
ncbi:hypothetical protein C8Q77DRAFT_602175 [Trametes polyzona]|nr:hypothetical protein C8Q77DRAFT_602175 [Trametes polyzona]